MHERVEKLKTHVRENRRVYISSLVGVLGGIAIGTTIMMRRQSSPISSGISGTADRGISVIGKKVVMSNVSYISQNRQGSPSWVVRCLETGIVFTSQRKAALTMDLPESEISKHLNGALDNVRGYRFERLCMAA